MSNPRSILTAVKIGVSVLNAQHGAVAILWRRFGQSIRDCRVKRGISPRRFAKLLDISPAYLGMLETGKRSWKMERADMAARLLARPEQWPDAGRPR